MNTDFSVIARSALASSADFWEYPAYTLTLELCRGFARLEKRNVNESLRACAATLAEKAADPRLRKFLAGMAKNRFAEADITVLRRMTEGLEEKLVKAMRLVQREKERLRKLHPNSEEYLAAVAAMRAEGQQTERV